MVTTEAFVQYPARARWLRRSTAAAIATAVLGVTGTGLAVGILSARQAETSGGTQVSSSSDDSSSTSSDSSGLGSAQEDAPTQGGSYGS